jgi:hypothetical protein
MIGWALSDTKQKLSVIYLCLKNFLIPFFELKTNGICTGLRSNFPIVTLPSVRTEGTKVINYTVNHLFIGNSYICFFCSPDPGTP